MHFYNNKMEITASKVRRFYKANRIGKYIQQQFLGNMWCDIYENKIRLVIKKV